MKYRILLISLSLSIALASQTKTDTILSKLINLGEITNSNEDFREFKKLKPFLKNTEIIMLGEQSHGEGTVYETKIKLIKYLHQEMGYNILAFESDFFGTQKTWELIQDGADIPLTMAKGTSTFWSTAKEFKALTDYIEKTKDTDNPLIITGFDNQQIYKTSYEYLIKDLTTYLKSKNLFDKYSNEINHLKKHYDLIHTLKLKKYKKKEAAKDTLFIGELINEMTPFKNERNSSFWIQTLKSLKLFLIDLKFKTYHRDKQMADNLSWLKKHNPDKKIICWGGGDQSFPIQCKRSAYKKCINSSNGRQPL